MIKQMTESEFDREKKKANKRDFSPYARWMMELKGMELHMKGSKIDKWEGWGFCKNPSLILNGQSIIKARKKIEK